MAEAKLQSSSQQQQQQSSQQPSSEQQSSQQQASERQRQLARRSEFGPSLFALSPFSMMRRLSEEMDRALARSFGLSGGGMAEPETWAPAVDVREIGGNLEVCAELPGMSKDDVRVEVTDEGLIIQGEKRSEHQSGEGGFHRSELSYGSFYRLIPLPEGVSPEAAEKAKAEFKNGVLHVQIPLSEAQRKTRQIPISSK